MAATNKMITPMIAGMTQVAFGAGTSLASCFGLAPRRDGGGVESVSWTLDGTVSTPLLWSCSSRDRPLSSLPRLAPRALPPSLRGLIPLSMGVSRWSEASMWYAPTSRVSLPTACIGIVARERSCPVIASYSHSLSCCIDGGRSLGCFSSPLLTRSSSGNG